MLSSAKRTKHSLVHYFLTRLLFGSCVVRLSSASLLLPIYTSCPLKGPFSLFISNRSHSSPFSIQSNKIVVVCGAAGGIGQPLSLLLKQSDLISHLALYDIVNAAGVAADLSHINTASKVTGHVGKDALAEALSGAHTVVIPAGVPRKPGMTRDDLFKVNIHLVITYVIRKQEAAR